MNGRDYMEKEYTKRQIHAYADSLLELSKCFKNTVSTRLDEETERENIFVQEKKKGEREILSEYLRDISETIDQMLQESDRFCKLPSKEEKRLCLQLKKEKLIISDIFYLNKDKDSPLCLMVSSKRMGGHSKKEVAGLLSVMLQRRLVPMGDEGEVISNLPGMYIFVQECKYMCLHGIARITKDGEEISGDNFSIMEREGGQVTVILSDGMGSGQKAAGDSCQVLDYMERLLDSGISPQKAMDAVNGLLLLREEGNMSTLDLCNIDLARGTCRFYKIGGVSSFLKSNTYVEKISSPSLPLGLWVEREQAFYAGNLPVIERELVDGDYIIMVTDGILDALGDFGYEKGLLEFLERLGDKYPKDMAERIIQYVLHLCKGKVEDDMTVMVLRIFDAWK